MVGSNRVAIAPKPASGLQGAHAGRLNPQPSTRMNIFGFQWINVRFWMNLVVMDGVILARRCSPLGTVGEERYAYVFT